MHLSTFASQERGILTNKEKKVPTRGRSTYKAFPLLNFIHLSTLSTLYIS